MKKALITGIAGQDGYFLCKFLLNKDYAVYGITQKKDLGTLALLDDNEREKLHLIYANITKSSLIEKIIQKEQFDEIYHLAAQSHVKTSFEYPSETFKTNINGTLNLVDAIKKFSPKTKLYFAATSELFGTSNDPSKNEDSALVPKSPYGISKLAGYWLVKNYRESYGLFLVNGILFNHESEIRDPKFVTRKITQSVANIYCKKQDTLEIGNLDAKRDWGYANDYIEAMWLMLQQEKPEDFVIATGEAHSVREFIEAAFNAINISIKWEGTGVDEIGRDSETNNILVTVNKEFFRPTDIPVVLGNRQKAKNILGWEPKVSFSELVKKMVTHDIKHIQRKKIALFVDSLDTHYGWGTTGYQFYKELKKTYTVTLINAKDFGLDQYNNSKTRIARIIWASIITRRKIPKDCKLAINTSENLYPLLFWSTRFKKMKIASIGYGTYSYFPFIQGAFKWLYNLYLSKVDQLFLSSNYSIKRVREFYNKHIVLLPLGVDSEKYHATQDIKKEVSLTFVGGQKHRKGIYQLLEAIKLVKKDIPEIIIYLIGSIDSEFRNKVIEEKLEKTFIFCGEISHQELLEYYSRSIGNILSSVNTPDSFEGFGLIHLEANACGIPSIGSKGTANDDVIIEGKTGFLAEQNNPEDIARCIKKLIEKKDFFAQNRDEIIQHAKKMNWERTVQILEDNFLDKN